MDDSLLWTDFSKYQKQTKFFGYFFPQLWACMNFDKKGLGNILGELLRNSSGHGGYRSPSISGLPDGLFSNQKSQIWVHFGGPLNGKCWYIL
jgi:hypothetical protein